jgi:hypothetical protein
MDGHTGHTLSTMTQEEWAGIGKAKDWTLYPQFVFRTSTHKDPLEDIPEEELPF